MGAARDGSGFLCRVAMALEKSDCVRDYVMCVFCFFTVFCDKILDPNYEKANFYFVSCSEEEDQGVLESEEEEEEMDSDSSVAVGGYFFFYSAQI